MRFGTVCSGIGAPEAAWHALGWQSVFASEIEAFPRAVLRHHWADTALHGDFTTIKGDEYGPVDVLCGGTPCQSFSVAGLRGGMADERGNLALEFLHLARRLRARWVLWENVPGVLSSFGGRDFGAFLGGLAECGYGFAYRMLDAQFFGLAQRRKRVFVVGYLGDWRPAAAVLFEPASLRGDPAPRREAGERVAPTVTRGSPGGRTYGLDADTADSLIAYTLTVSANQTYGFLGEAVARCLTSHPSRSDGETETFVPVVFGAQMSMPHWQHDLCDTLQAKNPKALASAAAVRRLTPRECKRLQGFPDDYTAISYRNGMAADGPRYKALGNSMAVPVMRWIGARIAKVDAQ